MIRSRIRRLAKTTLSHTSRKAQRLMEKLLSARSCYDANTAAKESASMCIPVVVDSMGGSEVSKT